MSECVCAKLAVQNATKASANGKEQSRDRTTSLCRRGRLRLSCRRGRLESENGGNARAGGNESALCTKQQSKLRPEHRRLSDRAAMATV